MQTATHFIQRAKKIVKATETAAAGTKVAEKWFAITTKHQHELTVTRLLLAKGITAFNPTCPVVHRWKDRNKVLQRPLFPGYVFFANGLNERIEILSTPGVFSIVSFGDVPAEIPGDEIEGIRKAVDSALPVSPHPFLRQGDRVRVTQGPLAGVCGILQRHKDAYRLVLSVELLGRSAAVEIEAATVERISRERSGDHPWTEQALSLSN